MNVKYLLFFSFVYITHAVYGMDEQYIALITAKDNAKVVMPYTILCAIIPSITSTTPTRHSVTGSTLLAFTLPEYSADSILQVAYVQQFLTKKNDSEKIKIIENFVSKLTYNEQETFIAAVKRLKPQMISVKDLPKLHQKPKEIIDTTLLTDIKSMYISINEDGINIISKMTEKEEQDATKKKEKVPEVIESTSEKYTNTHETSGDLTSGEEMILPSHETTGKEPALKLKQIKIPMSAMCATMTDEKKIFYLTNQGIFEYNTKNGSSTPLQKFTEERTIKNPAFSSNGNSLAYIMQKDSVGYMLVRSTLIREKERLLFNELKTEKMINSEQTAQVFSDMPLLAITNDAYNIFVGKNAHTLCIYKLLEKNPQKEQLSLISDITAIAISEKVATIDVLVGCRDGRLVLYQYSKYGGKFQTKMKFSSQLSKSSISCVSFAAGPHNSQYIFSGSKNGTIILWDKLRGTPIRVFEQYNSDKIISIVVSNPISTQSKKCSCFVSQSKDGQCILWPMLALGDVEETLLFFDENERMQRKIDLASTFINDTVIAIASTEENSTVRTMENIDEVYMQQVIFLEQLLKKLENNDDGHRLKDTIARLNPREKIDTLYTIMNNYKESSSNTLFSAFKNACDQLMKINPDFEPFTQDKIADRKKLVADINKVASATHIESLYSALFNQFPRLIDQPEAKKYNAQLAKCVAKLIKNAPQNRSLYNSLTWSSVYRFLLHDFFKKIPFFINPHSWLSSTQFVIKFLGTFLFGSRTSTNDK